MSGFGVITQWSKTPHSTSVGLLRNGIAHRGGDRNSTVDLGGSVLVHSQLITTPEAARERQPSRHVRNPWWLVADARIDNRSDLARVLRGHVEHPLDTDADFVLAAYECWGDELATHLIGDFAFALWDDEREHLLVVRDQVGIRPVFWALTGDGGFVASSVLRATLDASGRPHDPDLNHLAHFSTFSGVDAERTPWDGVRRLPGGHCLSIDRDSSPRTWRYWSPPDEYLDIGIDEAAERVRAAFETAVECRVRASTPVGAELSGGFDSTTVASVARSRVPDGGLVAYALSFPGESCDESPFIDAAARHLALDVDWFDALRVDPFDFVGDVRRTLDLPLVPDNQWLLPFHRVAAAAGRRVVLTGAGGDEALNSDQRVVADDLVKRGAYRDAWTLLRDTNWGWKARSRFSLESAARHRMPDPLARAVRRAIEVRDRRHRGHVDPTFLGPELRRYIDSDQREHRVDPFSHPRSIRRLNYTGSASYSWELIDRVGADTGIELRHPFMDIRLIELVVRLGEDVLAADARERGLHRRAFADVLPPLTLARRDKAEFSRPWVRAAVAPAEALCASQDSRLDGLINLDAVAAATQKYASSEFPLGNTWQWWGSVATGIWLMNCQP